MSKSSDVEGRNTLALAVGVPPAGIARSRLDHAVYRVPHIAWPDGPGRHRLTIGNVAMVPFGVSTAAIGQAREPVG
jgi:hypothetical protein